MKRFSVRAFGEAGESLEVYWLAGFEQTEGGDWLVRAVTRGMATQKLKMWKLPIGMLPLLSLGIRFDAQGGLLETQPRGQIQSATLLNLAGGVEITSADMPPGLHPFFGRHPGVQRLIRYKTNAGVMLIPTIELVRYLLVHNKTLANALMVPGQLMTLYHFQPVGIYGELTLNFTSDMPLRAISRDFALEFAWLAIHPEGRKTWDSVYRKSARQKYVSLDLPDVPDAQMVFRGAQQNGTWLVLEILHLTGRVPPCAQLRYGHPGFRKAGGNPIFREEAKSDDKETTLENIDVNVVIANAGTRIATGQAAVDIGAKSSEFTEFVPTEKVWILTESPRYLFKESPGSDFDNGGYKNRGAGRPVSPVRRRLQILGSVCRESRWSKVPPLEFRTLESYPWDFAGELQALAETITIMAELVANTEISMSLCRLKPGRAFSTVGRRARCCLVAYINVAERPPIVLLDIDRAGEWALSTMALKFKKSAPFSEIETHVKTVLDRLVDHGGHWHAFAEEELREVCNCTRLPKVLPKRGSDPKNQYRASWAVRLANKLGLPLVIFMPWGSEM